jgi:hypothetical protein
MHNRVWCLLIAGGWVLLLLTASVTGGFHHAPNWADYRWENFR